MYSLIEHIGIGILFLIIFHWLLDLLHVHIHARPFVEIILWSAVLWFILSGLWMPLL